MCSWLSTKLVTILWTFPNPQTNLDIRSDWDLLGPVSNEKHKDCHFKFGIRVENAVVTIDY